MTISAELADDVAFDAFKREAAALLFLDHTMIVANDPVAIRLAIAKEENSVFLAKLDDKIALDRETNRLPRPKEILAIPVQLAKDVRMTFSDARFIVEDIAATARRLAQSMSSRGLAAAARDLRRVRSDLPNQFAGAFERAGGLARQGGHHLKRHYEFLLEARELRTRYAELLSKTPDLSEKGKQFLARIELERRAEQVWDSSEGLLATGRRGIVVGIAYVIKGLQYIQAKITPLENKQLVLKVSPDADKKLKDEQAKPATPVESMRVLLPAQNSERAQSNEVLKRPSRNTRNAFVNDAPQSRSRADASKKHVSETKPLRDVPIGGHRSQIEGDEDFIKGRASLIDRLSAIDGHDDINISHEKSNFTTPHNAHETPDDKATKSKRLW